MWLLQIEFISILFVFARCDDIQHFPNYFDHECIRDCRNATPMTCYYDFTFELMYSMNRQCKQCLAGNNDDCFNEQCVVWSGLQEQITPINRMIPGPPVQVCENDRVEARVHNAMASQGATVHWHGVHLVNNNPMDGVDGVTQCAIPPRNYFTYSFDAVQTGTYFYHGHTPNHITTGLFGAVIVRPINDPNIDLYDYDLYEHVIHVYATFERSYDELVARYNYLHIDITTANMTGVGVNGMAPTVNNNIPPVHFKVKKGMRYRFRLINAVSSLCPIQVTIEKHRMHVIAADGHDVQQFDVDTLITINGDRIDFILEANQDANSYWMTFKGYETCGNYTSVALLDYEENTVERKKSEVKSLKLNTEHSLGCYEYATYDKCYDYNVINSLDKIDQRLLADEPDERYYLLLSDAVWVNPSYRGIGDEIIDTAVINNISFTAPAVPLLLQNANDRSYYCNANNKAVCGPSETVCRCQHVLDTGFNRTVELIILDLHDVLEIQSHMMHIHGYNFLVLGAGKTNATTIDELKRADANGELQRNFRNGVLKDSIRFAFNGGYGVLRFVTDNPGFWLLHCHVGMHFTQGMAVVFKSGDFTNIPANFPRCGNF